MISEMDSDVKAEARAAELAEYAAGLKAMSEEELLATYNYVSNTFVSAVEGLADLTQRVQEMQETLQAVNAERRARLQAGDEQLRKEIAEMKAGRGKL